MNPHLSLSTPAHNTAGTTTAVPVHRLVQAGLGRVSEAIRTIGDAPRGDALAHAARARRLAELYARRARWWAVLQRDTVDHAPDTAAVFIEAVVVARCTAEREARFWTDTAADWQARAEQRPTSDVAGAMSNWHELGLTDGSTPGVSGLIAGGAR